MEATEFLNVKHESELNLTFQNLSDNPVLEYRSRCEDSISHSLQNQSNQEGCKQGLIDSG